MPTALVIDDDRRFLFGLAELIEREGFTTATAATFEEARAELRDACPDVVLLDVVLPDGSGLDLLLEIPPRLRPQVLLMSGEESVRDAVRDMALRTVHFLQKPVDPDAVTELLRRVRRQERSRPQTTEAPRPAALIGSSPPMQHVYSLIAKVAPTDFAVYLEGESGTGKELAAEAIHAGSPRAENPFVAINCGAVPDSLVDSELFGHEKGAFTGATAAKKGVFEQAHGGTLFLDEITEMPMELQVRLLRVLETGRLRRVGGTRDIDVDVRMLTASNRSSERALADERIREDLFHRLCVFPITLPPLRERGQDIEELARHFLAEVGEREGLAKEFDPAALELLRRYGWPGNVRQLRNVVQRAYIVADDVITPDAIPQQVRAKTAPRRHGSQRAESEDGTIQLPVGTTVAEAERTLIEATLEEHDGDKRAAASALGISLRTLYNRLREYADGSAAEDSEPTS